jgi:8-oxo-dGTP pyrophosphatase MutT (NUDIX family)
MVKRRNKVVPASYLVLRRDGKVLLLRRFNTGYEDGNYSMVAGHVDAGETFTGAIIREAKEEAGIDIDPKNLKVVHVMHRDSKESDGLNERIDIFLEATQWSGDIENKESHKCDDLSWFDITNLPENIIPYVRKAVECIRDDIFYSEYGWK